MKFKKYIIPLTIIIAIAAVIVFANQSKGNGLDLSEIDRYMMNDLGNENLYIYSEWNNDDYLIKSFVYNEKDWGYYFFEKDKNTWVHKNTYNLKSGAEKNYIVTLEKSSKAPLWIALVNNNENHKTIYSVMQSENHNGETVTTKTVNIDVQTQYSTAVFTNEANYQNYSIYFDLGNDEVLVP